MSQANYWMQNGSITDGFKLGLGVSQRTGKQQYGEWLLAVAPLKKDFVLIFHASDQLLELKVTDSRTSLFDFVL